MYSKVFAVAGIIQRVSIFFSRRCTSTKYNQIDRYCKYKDEKTLISVHMVTDSLSMKEKEQHSMKYISVLIQVC